VTPNRETTMTKPRPRYLEARTQGGVLVLTIAQPQIEGEEIAQALRDELLDAVAGSAGQKVVVDFRHVRYVSSVAFGPLLALRRKLNEAGGRLLLCGLNSTVGDVFYTTRMVDPDGAITTMFEMEPDAAAAVARLNRLPTDP